MKNLYRDNTDTLVHLRIAGEEIVTTETHPFYVDGKGWVEAGKLTEKDKVQDSNHQTLEVEKVEIEELEEPVTVYNLEVEDYHTYFVGDGEVLVHNKCTPPVKGGSGANTGRAKNNIKPDSSAVGDHSVFKADPNTGKVTNYKTYEVNPKNPSGFQEVKGYDGVGAPHQNPVTGEDLMPHVHDKSVPGKVRAPEEWEIAK